MMNRQLTFIENHYLDDTVEPALSQKIKRLNLTYASTVLAHFK